MRQTVHTIVTSILGLTLIVSVVLGWRNHRSEKDVQKQLQNITDANNVLRETLGNMTKAMTDKDKQIDRLLRSSCKSPETHPAPSSPQLGPAKRPRPGSIGAN